MFFSDQVLILLSTRETGPGKAISFVLLLTDLLVSCPLVVWAHQALPLMDGPLGLAQGWLEDRFGPPSASHIISFDILWILAWKG